QPGRSGKQLFQSTVYSECYYREKRDSEEVIFGKVMIMATKNSSGCNNPEEFNNLIEDLCVYERSS
ncbi:MAG: hypothetical protein ABRQ37_27330, partial [Candidatus Eremiobacterota bacterium]